jgi:hypothetical protein
MPYLSSNNTRVNSVKVVEKRVSLNSDFQSRHHDVHRRLTSPVRKIAKHMQCTRVRFVNDIGPY